MKYLIINLYTTANLAAYLCVYYASFHQQHHHPLMQYLSPSTEQFDQRKVQIVGRPWKATKMEFIFKQIDSGFVPSCRNKLDIASQRNIWKRTGVTWTRLSSSTLGWRSWTCHSLGRAWGRGRPSPGRSCLCRSDSQPPECSNLWETNCATLPLNLRNISSSLNEFKLEKVQEFLANQNMPQGQGQQGCSQVQNFFGEVSEIQTR